MSGFTENYIKVETPFSEEMVNQLINVKLKSIFQNGHVGISFSDKFS